MKHTASRSWPLKLLLTSQFMLVAVIPLIAIVVLSLYFLVPQIQESRKLTQQALANSIAGQVKAYLDNAATDLGVLASFSVQTNIQSNKLQDFLDLYADNQQYFEAIYLTDSQGIIRQIGLPEYHQHLRQNFLEIDIGQSDIFLNAQTEGQHYWSNTFLSAISGRLSIAYARPMLDGYIIGEISVDELPQLVFKLADQYQVTVMILDRDRQLIAHPDPKYSLQQINLSNNKLVELTDQGAQTSELFLFQQQTLIGTATIIPDLNWMIIAAQDKKIIETERIAANKILITGIAIGLFAAAMIALLMAQEFINSFAHNTKHARALAQGDYDINPKRSRIRELNWLGSNLNTTAQAIKERENELTTRERRFRALVEQSPFAIIEWHTDYTVRTSNQLALSVLGTMDDEHNQNLAKLKSRVQTLDDIQSTSVNEFKASSNHRTRNLVSYNTRILDRNGDVLSYLSLIQDVTQQREAEAKIQQLNIELEHRVEERTQDLKNSNKGLQEALRSLKLTHNELIQSEKLAALGSLVAGVSHELNTPIGNSLMASSTLSESANRIHELSQASQLTRQDFDLFLEETISGNHIIVRNLQRSAELIKSFKQIAVDQSSSKQRPFELRGLLDEILITLNPMVKKTRVSIEIQSTQDINMDSFPGAIAQLITNLVQNALFHAFDGIEDGHIMILLEQPNAETARLSISDDGVGIPKDKIASIFDPFFTTKMGRGGSGLGLNIVHNLVTNLLRGTINVESTLGEGTLMVIELPLVIQHEQSIEDYS